MTGSNLLAIWFRSGYFGVICAQSEFLIVTLDAHFRHLLVNRAIQCNFKASELRGLNTLEQT